MTIEDLLMYGAFAILMVVWWRVRAKESDRE